MLSCVATQEQITASAGLLGDKKTDALINTILLGIYRRKGPRVLALYLPTWSLRVINMLV